MESGIKFSLFVGGVVMFLLAGGCRNGDTEPDQPSSPPSVEGSSQNGRTPAVNAGRSGIGGSEPGQSVSGQAGSGEAGGVPSPLEEEPTPPPTIPTVFLDAASEATCLVKVGESFPKGTLVDAEGKPVEMESLLGKSLAVVYFWTSKNAYAVAGLQELGMLVPKDLVSAGAVRVIAINEGDTAEAVKPLTEKAGSHVVNLFDPEGAYFAKIATEHLPRIYLIDADGKIVWFDIEYSSSMKRNLRQALEVALSTEPAGK